MKEIDNNSGYEFASTTLTNSILMPYSDGLTGSDYDLPDNTLSTQLAAVTEYQWNDAKKYTVSIRVGSDSYVQLTGVQSISGISMSRDNEQQYSGGDGSYVVNLPGKVTYDDVTLVHVFSRTSMFLDWIQNGTTVGGAARADLEIKMHNPSKVSGTKYMVFVLRDAFPVSWKLTDVSTDTNGVKTLTEEVKLTCSAIYFACETVP